MKKLIIKTVDGEHYEVRYPNATAYEIQNKIVTNGRAWLGLKDNKLQINVDQIIYMMDVEESEDE